MLSQAQRTTILELHKQGVAKREMARVLGVSRVAVRKVLRSNSTAVPALQRVEKAAPYRQQILEFFEKCRGNLVRVHEELLAGGAEMSYAALTGFCRRHGIATFAFFVVGLPGDTLETILRSIAFAVDIGANWTQFTVATPFAGTPMHDWAVRQGFIAPDFYKIINAHDRSLGNEHLRSRDIEKEKRRIGDHMGLLLACGSPVLVYAETTGTVQGDMDTPVADRPVMPESEFPAYGEKLTKLAEWMKAEGIAMTFHHHMGTVIEKEREVDLLMQSTGPAVGLLLDTGHLTFAGGNVAATTRRWGRRINHVHCKNIRPLVLAEAHRNHWSFLKSVIAGVFTV